MGGASADSDPRLEGGSGDSMSRFRVSKFRHVEAKVARKEVGGRQRESCLPPDRLSGEPPHPPAGARAAARAGALPCVARAPSGGSDPTEEGRRRFPRRRPTAGLSRARMGASLLPSELRPGALPTGSWPGAVEAPTSLGRAKGKLSGLRPGKLSLLRGRARRL